MQTKWIRFVLNFGLLLVLVLASASTAFAQSDTQVRITQVDNSKFPTVTLYVSATNSAGEPVGVDPSTIQITENGQVMEIVDARGGGGADGQGIAEPLTTMLVIDISGSMDKDNKLTAAKDAAKTYINQMRAGDQAGLMTFDTKTYYVQPVTTDTAALTSAIDGLVTGGDTSMFDALVEAEKNLQAVSGRKAIIVLADGLDNHSQNTADSVIEQIGPAGLTISTVGFGDASTAAQSGLDEAALKSMAEHTGGLYSFAADPQSLSALYQQLGRTLQSEYAITYVSPFALRDGINRDLTVSLTDVGAVAQSNYNPGGVLPEVQGISWTLFGLILAGLLLLLFIPALIGRVGGLIGNAKPKGRIKMPNAAAAAGNQNTGSGGSAGKKPRIKIK